MGGVAPYPEKLRFPRVWRIHGSSVGAVLTEIKETMMTEANIDRDYDAYCEFMDGLHTCPTREEHEFQSGMKTRDDQTIEMKEQLRQGLARSAKVNEFGRF